MNQAIVTTFQSYYTRPNFHIILDAGEENAVKGHLMFAIVHQSRLQSKYGGVPVESVVHDCEWLQQLTRSGVVA